MPADHYWRGCCSCCLCMLACSLVDRRELPVVYVLPLPWRMLIDKAVPRKAFVLRRFLFKELSAHRTRMTIFRTEQIGLCEKPEFSAGSVAKSMTVVAQWLSNNPLTLYAVDLREPRARLCYTSSSKALF